MNEQLAADLQPHVDAFVYASLVRTTDPPTSHEAAKAVRPGGEDLQKAIRTVARFRGRGGMPAELIARYIHDAYDGRWLESTIVSACNPKRSGLVVVGHTTNSRGRRVQLLALPDE